MKRLLAVLLVFSLCFIGCTHQLRLTNAQFSPAMSAPQKPVGIGFTPANYGDDTLIPSAIKELSLNAAVRNVKTNCQIEAVPDIDYFCDMNKTMNYRASGQNFWITFPGFILFTHAWLGYKYFVDITTQSKLMDPAGKELDTTSIMTPYELRHCSFARGAASSLIGWITPGWGLLDIIPGFIFMSSYDKRATPEFIEAAKPSYATFVSSKIIEQVAKVQQGRTSALQPLFVMDPVVIDNEKNADGSASSANDQCYAIYVWKEWNGAYISQTNQMRELPEETITLLRDTFNKEITPNVQDLKTILASLGIADEDIPKTLQHVSIYSEQGDNMVALYQGDRSIDITQAVTALK
jgi:hypothetical protein